MAYNQFETESRSLASSAMQTHQATQSTARETSHFVSHHGGKSILQILARCDFTTAEVNTLMFVEVVDSLVAFRRCRPIFLETC